MTSFVSGAVTLAIDCRNELGEMPLWDGLRGMLLRHSIRAVKRYTSANRPRARGRGAGEAVMREIVRTNNAVLVSAIDALFKAAQIEHMVLDQNMSVLEGSLGILPRRILVADEQELRARRLLEDAGLGHELRPEGR